jgi:hypothetical protein
MGVRIFVTLNLLHPYHLPEVSDYVVVKVEVFLGENNWKMKASNKQTLTRDDMSTCIIRATFGLKNTGDDSDTPVLFDLAIFNYDIGLQVDDKFIMVNSSDAKFDYLPAHEIEMQVTKRNQILKLGKEQDSFDEIHIHVEVVDGNDCQKIQERIENSSPGKYEVIRRVFDSPCSIESETTRRF